MPRNPCSFEPTEEGRYTRLENLRGSRRLGIAFLAALLAMGLLLVPTEWALWKFVLAQPQPLVAWMANFNSDTSLYLMWLCLLPLAWKLRFHLVDEQGPLARQVEEWLQSGHYTSKPTRVAASTGECWLNRALFCLVMIAGFVNVHQVQSRFGDLPPAFHDEYSYLFQAETFLAGRVTNPRFEPAPELFDQVHVLNNQPERFASRYFPGTGIWLSGFLAMGLPYLGYAVAQGLFCGMMFQWGRDLAGNGVGLLAGLLTALLPGMAIFGSLLLAHQPGLIGLGLFLWMFHRWLVSRAPVHALLASGGLAFAMLCRPMTAAGIGLPYGVWFLCLLAVDIREWKPRLVALASLGGPLLLTLACLFPYNQAVTGSPWVSPYQQYTQLHTPRHVYGYYNRSRGEAWIAQQRRAGIELPVAEHYDRWAQELTPLGSLDNLKQRLLASGQWTIGILPALAGLVFFLAIGQRGRPEWWLPLAAIFSLHLLHLPYWYDGIMHWHYVFESAPLLALIYARGTQLLAWNCRRIGRHWVAAWWLGLPMLGLLTAYTTFEPFWSSTLSAGVGELRFARERHAQFTHWIESQSEAPAVVFIRPDEADLHLDFVVNSPLLDTPLLRAHWLPEKYSIAELQRLFPGRNLYLADLVEQRFRPLNAARP